MGLELQQQTQAVNQPVVDEQTQQNQQDSAPQVDSYEQQAREQGWRPKEEYEGDPEKWRPAKEFVERGELFGKIDHMGKELKETRKALKMLQEHHSKVKETEYNNALKELKALQKKHLEEGNSDGYLEATELLTDLKAEQKAREVVVQNQPNQPDPRFIAWTQENKWYQTNVEMREYADTVGMGYASRNPGIDPEAVLQYVTKEVKARFKDSFVNPNRSKPNSVEGASAPAANKSSFELTDDERRVSRFTYICVASTRTGVRRPYHGDVMVLRLIVLARILNFHSTCQHFFGFTVKARIIDGNVTGLPHGQPKRFLPTSVTNPVPRPARHLIHHFQHDVQQVLFGQVFFLQDASNVNAGPPLLLQARNVGNQAVDNVRLVLLA